MNRLLFATFFFICFCAFGQSGLSDSLRYELSVSERDTNRVLILLKLGFTFYQSAPDSLLWYTNQGMKLAKDLGYDKGVASALNNLGTYAYVKSDYTQAEQYYQEFLEISEKIGDEYGVNKALNNLGVTSRYLGKYAESLRFYGRSVEISTKQENQTRLAGTLNNMGIVFRELGDYGKALEYFFKSLELKESLGNEESQANTLSSIGKIYFEKGDYEKAMEYLVLAFSIHQRFDSQLGMARAHHDIGNILQKQHKYDSALERYLIGLHIAKKQGNKGIVGNICTDMGKLYLVTGDTVKAIGLYDQAIQIFSTTGNVMSQVRVMNLLTEAYAAMGQIESAISLGERSLKMAIGIHAKKEIGSIARILHPLHSKRGDYEKAYDYSKLQYAYHDSLNHEKMMNELVIFENRFQLEKIANENQMLSNQNQLNQAELERSRLQIQRQNLLIYGGFIFLVLTLSLLYVLYRYFRTRKSSIDLLEKKNEEIVLQAKVLSEQAEELVRVNEEMVLVNESLEEKVRQRTERIQAQNEKLKTYAFSNAHLVRAPLARILGIVELLKKEVDLPDAQRELLYKSMLESAEELDQIIRRVSSILETEK